MSAGRHFPLLALACLTSLCPSPVLAQSASDDAHRDAEDAFGGSVGHENVGIYTTSNVRGFDPQKAGNARIEGVYFDQLTSVSSRARDVTTIRVGFAALDTFGPSPTGIVAYRLHSAGDDFGFTFSPAMSPYNGPLVASLARVPVVERHVSFTAGLAFAQQAFSDGSHTDNIGWGFLPRVSFGGVELRGIFSGFLVAPDYSRPITQLGGPFLPELPKKGRYLGQKWARGKDYKITNGATLRADIAEGLRLDGGMFQSRWDFRRKYTEIFRLAADNGRARHLMVADPRQDKFANSWEALLSYRFGEGRISHIITAGTRGRFRHIESGGSDLLDFGEIEYGEKNPEDEPEFQFRPVNLGKLRQVAYVAGYRGKWDGVGQINLGINKTDYDASFTSQLGTTRSSANPWLYNASVLVKPAGWLSLYAGVMTGLEDNGSAPDNAVNSGEQLPAVRTRQIDGGLQAKFGRMTLVTSAFQITKPYFSFNASGVYTQLGGVRHRGLEASLIGDVTDRLHAVAGAVMMDPVVTGDDTGGTRLGKRPVGVAKIHARADISYRTDILGGLTFTAGMAHDSRRAASAQTYPDLGGKQLFLPARTTFDLGARHKFKLGRVPSSLRFVVENVFDRKSWDTIASNSLQTGERRRWSLFLISDF